MNSPCGPSLDLTRESAVRLASSQGTLLSASLASSSHSACCEPRTTADSSASSTAVATEFAAIAVSVKSSAFASASSASASAGAVVDAAAAG